jgi:hypothetical protein
MSTDNGFEWVEPDEIEIEDTEWAWENRIEKYGLNNVIGPEKVGKGFFNVRTLSRLTAGKLEGCYKGEPIYVAIVAYEDRKEEWAKRMQAAGADKDMWGLLKRESGEILEFNRHLKPLFKELRARQAVFVYFDQLLDHMGMQDSNNTHQVRRALAPLAYTLNEQEVGALANGHPNKRRNSSFRDRMAGSAAIYAVGRTMMYIAEHPFNSDLKVVIPSPSNHGPQASALEFRIASKHLRRPDGKVVRTGRAQIVEWFSNMTLDDLDVSSGAQTERAKRLDEELAEFLRDGAKTWSEVEERFPDHSRKVLGRAAKRSSVLISSHGPGKVSQWSLPLQQRTR